MKHMIAIVMAIYLTGCSALAGFGMDALTGAIGGGSKGGINTELVVGDKEQTLGNNIEVKADHVDKVVGSNDNSVALAGEVENVEITNVNYPTWLIATLLGLMVLFLCLPTPTQMWKSWRNRKKK